MISDSSNPNKKQKTYAGQSVGSQNSENSEKSTSSNYQVEEDGESIIEKFNFLNQTVNNGDQQLTNEITGDQRVVDFIEEKFQQVKKRQKQEQERGREYRAALLIPYRNRNEKEYKKKITELFQEKFPSLLEIIFSANELDWHDNEQYRLCLYKFFLEFVETKKFANWKDDCKEILAWLVKNQIEEVLEKKDHLKVAHFLILNNNPEALEWMFKNSTEQQLKELFIEDNKIFDLLATEDCNDKQIKIINLVFRKFRELLVFVTDKKEEQERQISEKKEQLKLDLLENSEWEIEMWTELEDKLII